MKLTPAIEPVFILAGQSNMAGRCDAAELPNHLKQIKSLDFQICWDIDRNFVEDCNSDGKFLSLQPQTSTGLNMDIFGPEMAMAHSLAPRLEKLGVKRAHFIKFALGSTNLHTNWNPSNTLTSGKMSNIGYYPQFQKFCKESLEFLNTNAAPCSVILPLWGMFWLQGESDSSKANTANSYLSNFEKFIQTVRQDLKHPNLPVVVSPIIWKGKKVHLVNEALQRAADSEIQHCYCIEPLEKDKFSVQGKEAGVGADHLTAAGLCEIGHRMGNTIPLSIGVESS